MSCVQRREPNAPKFRRSRTRIIRRGMKERIIIIKIIIINIIKKKSTAEKGGE